MRSVILVLAVLAIPVSAGMTQYGLHAGLFIPTGDPADVYNLSPMIGGQILVHMPVYAIEGSASYVFLSADSELDGFSAHMIPLSAGLRSYSGPIFFGGGAELAISSVSWDVSADSTYEDSESDFGAYGTLGTTLPLAGYEVELTGKAHWVDFDDIWMSVQLSMYL